MSNSSFYSLLTLSIVTYCCCVGLFVGDRLRIKKIEKRLAAAEQSQICFTNDMDCSLKEYIDIKDAANEVRIEEVAKLQWDLKTDFDLFKDEVKCHDDSIFDRPFTDDRSALKELTEQNTTITHKGDER